MGDYESNVTACDPQRGKFSGYNAKWTAVLQCWEMFKCLNSPHVRMRNTIFLLKKNMHRKFYLYWKSNIVNQQLLEFSEVSKGKDLHKWYQ